MISGFLFFLQPVVEIALDAVGGNGEAPPLLEDDAVELQPGEGVLQILAEVGEIGALLFRIAVVLPEAGDDLAIAGLSSAIVYQQGHDLLGLGILEHHGLAVHEELKVSEGLGEEAFAAV